MISDRGRDGDSAVGIVRAGLPALHDVVVGFGGDAGVSVGMPTACGTGRPCKADLLAPISAVAVTCGVALRPQGDSMD